MWKNDMPDSEMSSLYYEQDKDSPRYQNISATWDSDGYTNYTPSFESTDAEKYYDRGSPRRHKNDSKANSNDKYHYEQDFYRGPTQFKHWMMDVEDSKTKSLRPEWKNKKESSEEKRKGPKQINPGSGYVVNAPSCYGYFSYDEVIQQLQGNRKIYKHSTDKKLY